MESPSLPRLRPRKNVSYSDKPLPLSKSSNDHSLSAVAVVAASDQHALTPLSDSDKGWTHPKKIMLLEEMVDYSEKYGGCKLSMRFMSRFHSTLRGSPLQSEFSGRQVLEKMKRFKRIFDEKKAKEGKGKKPNDDPKGEEIFSLLGRIWGGAEEAAAKGMAAVEDDADSKDEEEDNVEEDPSVEVPEMLLWEEAMVSGMEEVLSWPRKATCSLIASMDAKSRVSMAEDWVKRKRELDAAVFKMYCLEEECIETLHSCPSP